MILKIWKECPICYEEHYCRIKCNEKQYTDYQINYKGLIRPKKAIQEIFPDLSKEQREFIKSGTCRRCQKNIF